MVKKIAIHLVFVGFDEAVVARVAPVFLEGILSAQPQVLPDGRLVIPSNFEFLTTVIMPGVNDCEFNKEVLSRINAVYIVNSQDIESRTLAEKLVAKSNQCPNYFQRIMYMTGYRIDSNISIKGCEAGRKYGPKPHGRKG